MIVEIMIVEIIFLTFFSGVIVCLINCFTNSNGLEFVNPIYLYTKFKVNWFGAGLIAIVFNILCFPFSCCYWLYKLCTVGRKDE